MDYYSGYITKLIEELSGLPGIGPKTAGRLAFHILDMPKEQVESLANSMIDAKKNVRYCKCCYTLTDQDICPICSSKERDHKTIMVVETTKDMAAYEKIGEYKGVYHILHGAINPMAGIIQNDIFKLFKTGSIVSGWEHLYLTANAVCARNYTYL